MAFTHRIELVCTEELFNSITEEAKKRQVSKSDVVREKLYAAYYIDETYLSTTTVTRIQPAQQEAAQ